MSFIYTTDCVLGVSYFPTHCIRKIELEIPKPDTLAPTRDGNSTIDMEPVTMSEFCAFMQKVITHLKRCRDTDDDLPNSLQMYATITVYVDNIFFDQDEWNKKTGFKGKYAKDVIEATLEPEHFPQIFRELYATHQEVAIMKEYVAVLDEAYPSIGEEDDDEDDVESRAQAAADNDEEGQRIMQEEATQDVLDEEAAREMETPGEDDPLDAESLEAFNQAMEKDD